MRRIAGLGCLAAAVAVAVAIAASVAAAAAPRLTIIGFSGDGPQNNAVPRDMARPGGTYESCHFANLRFLYAWVTYSGMEKGMATSVRWLRGGRVVSSESFGWDIPASGTNWFKMTFPKGNTMLWDGTYTVRFTYAGKLLATASVDRGTTLC